MNSYLDQLPRPFFILAPMDDVTDAVFRQVIADCARPELFFTEFVNVDGLQSVGRPNIFKRLKSGDADQPLIAQFWGKTPENYYKTAQQIADGNLQQEIGNKHPFSGFDINMGCPDKAIIKNGCCGALIDNRQLAADIINSSREGLQGSMPLSVKTRVGLRTADMTWIEFLLNQNIDMLSVHVRTVKEQSLVPAHHELFEDIIRLRDQISPSTKIVGNGDIVSRRQGEDLADKYKLDGVMIGRGIFKDPFLFSDESSWSSLSPKEKMQLYRKHVNLFEQTWKNNERKVHTLNKFCKVYINEFEGAKEHREKLMKATSTQELQQILTELEAAS